MASITIDMDMGDLGTNEVIVQYVSRNGYARVTNVYWQGLDVMALGLIDSDVEDALEDSCRADMKEADECAAEAHWEWKREERRMAERGAA